ncbi:MAG: hypothetical protein WCC30_09980 [Candidatus Dormiibacterota bacterium]
MPATHGLLGRIQRANDDASRRFGPHTSEVEAFISATGQLTPWQWRQVLAVRRLVTSVSKEGTGERSDSARSIQAAIRTNDARISEPMARAGEVLFDTLVKKSDEKQVAAWQAMSALVMRSWLPALKFAAHYAPFVAFIPVSGDDVLDPRSLRFVGAIESLTKEQCEALAHRWRIDPAASRALLQAVTKNRQVKSEEAAAMAALTVIPTHLPGDAGWFAVRTAVHGGRVLGSLGDLSPHQITELWAPLQEAIRFESLDSTEEAPALDRVRSVVSGAIKSITGTRRAARLPATPAAKAPAPYGSNSAEVAAFINGVSEMTPIQWLRVLDRRKLVASITREGSAEPAGVVRSILAAIEGTRELDTFTRCRAFAAVERAGFAAEAHGHLTREQVDEMYAPFSASIPMQHLNGGGFAHKLAALGKSDWEKVAAEAPEVNEEAVAPLVNAGTALIDFFGGRSDDEAVAAWHAVSALVRRHQLTAIKFAASYAPFASAIPVTSPRSLGAMVSRYVTAIGRLGSTQCVVLSQPWQISDDLSNVLSKALADGSARPAEEAAALAAVVTVPMRLSGSNGWAAVKTAAFGGRVIASRNKLTPEQLESLWLPIQQAIPLASLGAPSKPRR